MGTKNNLEIERKFLLKKVPTFLAKDVKRYLIHQVYVDIDGQVTRFRMTEDLRSPDNETTYVKCVKKPISTGIFEEIEVKVSQNIFDKMTKKPHRFIIKERLVYNMVESVTEECAEIKIEGRNTKVKMYALRRGDKP